MASYDHGPPGSSYNENLERHIDHGYTNVCGNGMQPDVHALNGIQGWSEPQPNPNRKSCSLCESGMEAEYHCHWCQHSYCKICQRSHDKLCGNNARQINAMFEDLQRRCNEFSQTCSSLQASVVSHSQNLTSLTDNQGKLIAENQSLASQSEAQKSEILSMRQMLISLREENMNLNDCVVQLQKDSTSLSQSVVSLRDEHAALDQTVGILKKENSMVHNDFGKLQQEVGQVIATQRADSSSQNFSVPTKYDDSQVQADILQLQSKVFKVESDLQSLREERNKVMETCSKAVRDNVPQVARLEAVVSRLEVEVEEMKKSSTASGFSTDAAAADVSSFSVTDNPAINIRGASKNTTSVEFRGNRKERRSTTSSAEEEEEEEQDQACPVCLDPFISPKTLECGHKFCTDCINRAMAVTPTCPKCKRRYAMERGTQPQNGTMVHTVLKIPLPGYEGCGTILITYNFPSGNQEKCHPTPGRFYHGTQRTAYLPDNGEGREVLSMLYKAFSHRLIFTIGTSATTGASGVITWNDIHHKTNTHGGPSNFGYPDPHYLSRVKMELADKGIFPA